MSSSDVLILGGGAIGLSIAYELSSAGARVHVVDRAEPGRASSWAGAGMIPPAPLESGDPIQQLARLSEKLHPEWARRLLEQTGIDVEYRRTGALYVACEESELAWLADEASAWQSQGVEHERIEPRAISDWEPEAMAGGGQIVAAYHLPGEAQLRNPRFVRALASACALQGVRITAGAEVIDLPADRARVLGARTTEGTYFAERICLAAGAWTAGLAARLGLELPVAPVRGQIALLNPGRPVLRRIINRGPRYLVPRVDGRVLVGSTMERVGFDTRTTAAGIGGLLEMAAALAPGLSSASVERTWAGLRPGTPDGLPYLGRLPRSDNAFIAAGHYRSGLQLAPATAVVMGQLIRGSSPGVPLDAFCAERHAGPIEPRRR